MPEKRPYKIQFVCLGNICRSPTAHHVMQHLIDEAGLSDRIVVESSGTCSYHVGELPDSRMRTAVKKAHGITMTHRARQFTHSDFADSDQIFAMDRSNRSDILSVAKTPAERSKVCLFREFDPASGKTLDTPDPYYKNNFDEVVTIVTRTCAAILEDIKSKV